MDPRVPDREAFRIGEVAALAGVTPSVLRFWETRAGFGHALQPHKTRSGQRLYTRADVARVLQIRDLLYDRGFTIAGARQALRGPVDEDDRKRAVIEAIRDEAHQLLRLLDA